MHFYLNCINNNFPRHATCSLVSLTPSFPVKRNALVYLSRVRHDVEQGAADDHRGNKIHRESRFTVCIATFRSPYHCAIPYTPSCRSTLLWQTLINLFAARIRCVPSLLSSSAIPQ